MTYIPPPKIGRIIDKLTRIPWSDGTRWRDEDGQIYTWDGLHGEFEVFTKRGRHLGAVDSFTGEFIKEPERGRKIDV
jgi:hypothetical protein